MQDIFTKVIHGQLFRQFLIFGSFITVAVVATDSADLIEPLNILYMCFAVGVLAAYGKVFFMAWLDPVLSRGQVLAVGIVLTQSYAFFGRLISLLSRSFGLGWIVNTDLVSICTYLGVLGAMSHLNAPEVIDGGVPTQQWIKIGKYAFAAALLFGLVIYARLSLR